MIQDLHSHTYYSFCGQDRPELTVEAAIAGGVELFGICDHNYGIGMSMRSAFKAPLDVVPNEYYPSALQRYYDHINLIKEKYADRIRVLRGIEVATNLGFGKVCLPENADISFFDYCLIEHLDYPESSIKEIGLFDYAEKLSCPMTGVAHTDLFTYIASRGEDPYTYFRRMAEQNIFWEMNVSYDTVHNFRIHPYMLRFFEDKEQQAIVRESGARISVGFDGHRVEDYRPDRVRDYCRQVTEMGIKLAFEE